MKAPKYLDEIIYFFSQTFNNHASLFLLTIALVLSAFTHLWNPIGFPSIWVVEGQYMHRTMHVLETSGYHHESGNIYPHPYDHPYFGQYFLALMLAIFGYPESLNLSTVNIHSIEMLYLLPKIIMGILAVFDTFLLYKISYYRYNRNIALIASFLFAVMPITWILRKILLDSLLLPLLLSSILFAIYTKDQKLKNNKSIKNKNILLVLLSGIFLGLAILTKIPIFTMIPLVGYLVYTSNNKNRKILGIWFIPIILIPLSWPLDAMLVGDFDVWLNDIRWNTERENNSDSPVGGTLLNSLKYLFQIEPVLLILGFAGIFFAEIKRDFLILLWIIPFLIFLFTINFVSFFHLIPLLPAFCIAAARLIVDLSNRIRYKKIHRILPFAVISGIGIFGFINITMLITTNVTSSYFEVYAFMVQYLANLKADNNNDNDDTITMIGRHWTRGLYWIPRYVYDIDLDFKKVDDVYDIPVSIKTEKGILIVDNTIKNSIANNNRENQSGQLNFYYHTIPIATFKNKSVNYNFDKYPYNNMKENQDLKWIEIRANENIDIISWDLLPNDTFSDPN